MVGQPFTGAGYLLRGLQLIGRPGLRRFVAIPLAINVVLFSLMIWLGAHEFENLLNALLPQLPSWLSWLSWLLWLFFALAVLLIFFYTFTLVANIVASPFNAFLAEAVELQLTGREPEQEAFSMKALIASIGPALRDEMKKLLYFLVWAIPLGILFFIPLLNLAAPFLWALFSAWSLALEYSDFPMGNDGLEFAEQRRRLGGRKLLALGFGGTVLVGTLIPLLNLLVIPAAVAGATAMWVEQLKTRP